VTGRWPEGGAGVWQGDGAALRAWRQSRGWDAPEVASYQGLVRMVYGWERGDHALTERYALLYARVLGIDPDDLAGGPVSPAGGSGAGGGPAAVVPAVGGGAWRGRGPVSSEAVPVGTEDVGQVLVRLALAGWARGDAWDVDEMERRELLRMLGGMAAVAPLAGGLSAETVRRNLDGALNAPTTKADVAEWERVAAQYSAESGIVPPAVLLPELLTDLDEAQRRLQGAPESLRSPMARVCGYLGALAAMNYFNGGDERSANRYWRTALRIIGLSDDRSAHAELRAHRAMFYLLEARPSPSAGLALADEAIGIGGAAPCAGTANGYAGRAQALALLGEHRESTRTLQDLADTFTRMPGAQGSARSSWGYSEQSLRFIEGFVYAHAGRVPEAGQALDAGRSLIPDGQWIAATSFEVTRGLSLIRGGDPSEGARHVVRAIQAMPAGFRASGATRRAALALEAVPADAVDLPAVAEARELLALPTAGV
jgi:hypothetical protein